MVMLTRQLCGLIMLTILLPAGLIIAEPAWDILNQTYGSGTGQVSFKSNYTWQWGGTPTETRFEGYVRLIGGSTINYASRPNGTIGMPSSGTWRVDIKMKLLNAIGGTIYLGDNHDPRRGYILTINHLHSETIAHKHTLGDYNLGIPDGGNIAPEGFNGAIEHVYSFRSVQGKVYLYLDEARIGLLTNGAGAQTDG